MTPYASVGRNKGTKHGAVTGSDFFPVLVSLTALKELQCLKQRTKGAVPEGRKEACAQHMHEAQGAITCSDMLHIVGGVGVSFVMECLQSLSLLVSVCVFFVCK
jgi:hypothetical protein